jgi:hypothetical protein
VVIGNDIAIIADDDTGTGCHLGHGPHSVTVAEEVIGVDTEKVGEGIMLGKIIADGADSLRLDMDGCGDCRAGCIDEVGRAAVFLAAFKEFGIVGRDLAGIL